jgi:Cu+-exporting ATPase
MEQGVEVIMLTGDNHNTAKAVADELHLTNFKAECLPQDKLNEIKRLQAEGKIVAMAGDGINDAPASGTGRHWYRNGHRNRCCY